jgi:Fucose-binding lectin II (PA-IIL)
MSDCTTVGFSGKVGFKLEGPQILPQGKIVFVTGYTQAGAKQTVTVMRNGVPVAQVEGSGATGLLQPSSGHTNHFISDGGPYTITFTNSGSQDTRVLVTTEVINIGTLIYLGGWTFIGEDVPNGGDCDFNDVTAFLTWHMSAG